MENVKEQTGQDWENENDFNPSFAATKMIPYVLNQGG
jgi:hypothetical protein